MKFLLYDTFSRRSPFLKMLTLTPRKALERYERACSAKVSLISLITYFTYGVDSVKRLFSNREDEKLPTKNFEIHSVCPASIHAKLSTVHVHVQASFLFEERSKVQCLAFHFRDHDKTGILIGANQRLQNKRRLVNSKLPIHILKYFEFDLPNRFGLNLLVDRVCRLLKIISTLFLLLDTAHTTLSEPTIGLHAEL